MPVVCARESRSFEDAVAEQCRIPHEAKKGAYDPTAKFVLLTLHSFPTKTGLHPRIDTIAERATLDQGTVKRAIARLVRLGFVKREKRGTLSNLYTIDYDALNATVPEGRSALTSQDADVAQRPHRGGAAPSQEGAQRPHRGGAAPPKGIPMKRTNEEEPNEPCAAGAARGADGWGFGKPAKKSQPPKYDPAAEPIPTQIDTPAMRTAWGEWCGYRAERKPAVTPRSAKITLNRFTRWGVEAAIQSIEEAISNGWQGVFEPKSNGHPRVMQADRGLTMAEARAKLAAANGSHGERDAKLNGG